MLYTNRTDILRKPNERVPTMIKNFIRTSLSLLLCMFLLYFALLPQPCNRADFPIRKVSANANPLPGSYACILKNNVYLYATADGKKGLFLLPETYYVRLLEYRPDYSKVEYQRSENTSLRVLGYVQTEKLTFVDYIPQHPYLYYTFDVTDPIEDSDAIDSSFLTQIPRSCLYYGDYPVGSENYCYVLRGEEFGYIPKPDYLQWERNTEYEEYLASLTPPPSSEESSENPSNAPPPMQIAILVVICLLVPVLAGLILKPPQHPSYETEE